MLDYQVYIGFWIDHSYSTVLGATLTLPIRWANYVVSALTVAVTISATCFWIITAYCLHQSIVHHGNVDVVGLQNQVILRNSSSPLGSLWELIKVQLAWRNGTIPKVRKRKLLIAVPALLIWLLFTTASVFVSEIASKSYTETEILMAPTVCGSWAFNTTTVAGLGAASSKTQRDTIRGRLYAGSWYDNSSTSLATRSLFPVNSLPYITNANTSCPFDASRCLLGQNTAFSMATPLLDSHSMFGINAPKSDRVQFQKNVTCAVVNVQDMTEVVNNTIFQVYVGSIVGFSNYTFQYNELISDLGS